MTLQFVSNLMFFMETLLGSMAFTHFVPKRESHRRNFIAATVLAVILLGIYNLSVTPEKQNEPFFQTVSYLLAAVLTVCVMCGNFRVRLVNVFYLLLAGNCLRMCAYFFYRSICGILLYHGFPDEMLSVGTLSHFLILLPVLAAVYAFFYQLFFRQRAARDMNRLGWRDGLPFAVSLIVNIIYSVIEDHLLQEDKRIYALIMLALALMYFQLLFLVYMMSVYSNSQIEAEVMGQLWQEKRHQYEQTKESMDIINIKCHDLRHQLRAIRGGEVSREFVEEMEEALYIYDSQIKTGNETLDIIVSDKLLLCEAKKITMNVMASAAQLSFMKQADIVSLFSNLLENAMEYEETIEEKRRFIRLSVRPVESFLSICVENTFDGRLEMEDGLPVSYKENSDFHGIGLKSVRYTVEKYHGQLDICLEEGMFRAKMVFPLPPL